MTPKERAEYLINLYLNTSINFPYKDTEDGYCVGAGYMIHNSAKECALIAVKLLIENDTHNSHDMYWDEVKEEIIKQ